MRLQTLVKNFNVSAMLFWVSDNMEMKRDCRVPSWPFLFDFKALFLFPNWKFQSPELCPLRYPLVSLCCFMLRHSIILPMRGDNSMLLSSFIFSYLMIAFRTSNTNWATVILTLSIAEWWARSTMCRGSTRDGREEWDCPPWGRVSMREEEEEEGRCPWVSSYFCQ